MLNNMLQIFFCTGSKRVTAAKTTGDLIGDKIADKITKTSSQNNSETVTNKTKNIDY